ncbi:hypothetical protein NEHOM01_0214 [Nematocida homosporus]|uniref:uncharacterized protein n=1 Tax=Nematocida homosporus TaxID=1912981 RepID=UPI00221F59F9|nr:uncharacterized protein NEHOM01_0214 [Nematocida homosporus]KAI5184539.1 hypothetical protein NEHOM01_0214 [Nematocida homosporus]
MIIHKINWVIIGFVLGLFVLGYRQVKCSNASGSDGIKKDTADCTSDSTVVVNANSAGVGVGVGDNIGLGGTDDTGVGGAGDTDDTGVGDAVVVDAGVDDAVVVDAGDAVVCDAGDAGVDDAVVCDTGDAVVVDAGDAVVCDAGDTATDAILDGVKDADAVDASLWRARFDSKGRRIIDMTEVLSLEELGDELKFPWAIDLLNRLESGQASGTVYFGEDGDNARIGYNEGKDLRYFKGIGFYSLLSGSDLFHQVKVAASLLKRMFTKKGVNSDDLSPSDVLDVVLIYTNLDQNINIVQTSDDILVKELHIQFIENLTRGITNYYTKHGSIQAFSDSMEVAVLDSESHIKCGASRTALQHRRSAMGQKCSFADTYSRSLIIDQESLDLFRASPLINYLHPLSLDLYQHGLNCLYNGETNLFTIIKHNQAVSPVRPTLNPTNLKLSFKAAVRLRYATNAQNYTVMATDEDFQTFLNVLSKHAPQERGDYHSYLNVFKRHSILDADIIRKHWDEEERDSDRLDDPPQRSTLIQTIALSLITLTTGFVVFILTQVSILLSSYPILIYTMPIIIISIGLAIALLLLFFIYPPSNQSRKSHSWQYLTIVRVGQYCLFGLVLCLVTAGVFINLAYPPTLTFTQTDPAIPATLITLLYHILAGTSILGCLIIRGLFTPRWPTLPRYSYWLLYVLSFIFIISIPILTLLDLTAYAQLLLNTRILLISALLFTAGAFIDVFGRWFDKERTEHLKPRPTQLILRKLIKILLVLLVLAAAYTLTIWTSNRHNLLTQLPS